MTEEMLKKQMEISEANSKKLDLILLMLQGQKDMPGILERVQTHDEILQGVHGELGIVQKVTTMWRVHVWILCTLSSGASALAVYIFKK